MATIKSIKPLNRIKINQENFVVQHLCDFMVLAGVKKGSSKQKNSKSNKNSDDA